jgi:2,4-dienoyl-CoA reductase-like NADH-dependent reductase (Old Yellow Enzyme family)
MTEEDMEDVRSDFSKATILAKSAGFDAVEIHSGHGYLLSQFLSSWSNNRKDDYGGSLENRLRFPASVIQHVREKAGPDFPVIVKMNVRDGFKGGLEVNEAIQVAQCYEIAGASALVLSCGFTLKAPLYMVRGRVPVMEFAKGEKSLPIKIALLVLGKVIVQHFPFNELFLLQEAKEVRKAVKMPLVLVGGVCSIDNMNTAMDEGLDFVQIGRATIRDPNIVKKMESGEIITSDCDHCNRCIGKISGGPVKCVCLEEGRALPTSLI